MYRDTIQMTLKRLNYFVADSFRITPAKFCQNCPMFVEDMTKMLAYFFDDYVSVSIP